MQRDNNIFLGLFSLLLVIVLALMGCGGGSAGTGTGNVVVQGAVLDQSGEPVENVDIRVVETGSEATTAQDGHFEILGTSAQDNVTLEVSSTSGTAFITVDMPQDGGEVSITLAIDPALTTIDAASVEMSAGIVGQCDSYFENKTVIRQSNRVPGNLRCVARVAVGSDNGPLAHAPIVIQYNNCDETEAWTTLAAGSTFGYPNTGVGQIEFPFVDDGTHCVYRIVAPYGVPGLPQLERRIVTYTYQRAR